MANQTYQIKCKCGVTVGTAVVIASDKNPTPAPVDIKVACKTCSSARDQGHVRGWKRGS